MHLRIPGKRLVSDHEDDIPKIKIEVVLSDAMATEAVQAIAKAAKTGKIGDGKIFVSPIENAVRIRTEERGEQAV